MGRLEGRTAAWRRVGKETEVFCSVRKGLGDGQGSIAWLEITALPLDDPLVFNIPGYVYNGACTVMLFHTCWSLWFFQESFCPLCSKFKCPDDGLGFLVIYLLYIFIIAVAHRCESCCSESNHSWRNSLGRVKFILSSFMSCSHLVCSVVLSRNFTPCSRCNPQQKWVTGAFWNALSILWQWPKDVCLNFLLSYQQPLSMAAQNQHGLK